MPAASAPDDLVIHSRPLETEADQPLPRHWLNNDPVGTAVMNALSLTFPDGERFFIQSVKRFSTGLPPQLARDVKAFTDQEGAHTREHMAFNAMIETSGFETKDVEALVSAQLQVVRLRPPLVQLAATVALEHFTASFAHLMLSEPRLLDGAPPHVIRLWQWHAIEEIEHKSVAYDVFMHATKAWSPWRRWMIRRWIMIMATLMFTMIVHKAARRLLAQDNISGWRAHARLFAWLWLKPGFYRKVFTDYLSFYRPFFHPWQIDDRQLITETEARLMT